MKVGDHIFFMPQAKTFDPKHDEGVIVARSYKNFRRPWRVRWPSGFESCPLGTSIKLASSVTVSGDQ